MSKYTRLKQEQSWGGQKLKPIEKVVTKLVSICEEHEVLPWDCPYLRPESIPPQNPVTGTTYSGGNSLYLGVMQWLNNYQTPFYTTYNGAKTLGGNVSKGEKGYPIIVARTVTREDEKDPDHKIVSTYFGNATVFNLDQCEGIDMSQYLPDNQEPPQSVPKNVSELKQFVESVNPMIVPGRTPAYSPHQDVIKMPRVESFVSVEAYYQTLFHEMVHWTGHETRLGREFGTMFGSEKYSKEELIAEIGAATLSHYLIGDDNAALSQSAAYVKSWLSVLKKNPLWLFKSATESETAVYYLIGRTKVIPAVTGSDDE